MTVEEIMKPYPNLVFVKTRFHIENQNQLKDENFIFEDDTPELKKNQTQIMPLSITDFPGVLASSTAMEAGAWAITICQKQSWEISRENIEACLANLEMDFQLETPMSKGVTETWAEFLERYPNLVFV